MNTHTESYCRDLVRRHAYPDYLCLLALPAAARPAVLAVLALDVELRLVASKVSEEMIAHIRYAWWREGVAGIYLGQKPREHPVFTLLAGLAVKPGEDGLQRMVHEAQVAWPHAHGHSSKAAMAACEEVLTGDARALVRWRKAQGVVERHQGKRVRTLVGLLFLRDG